MSRNIYRRSNRTGTTSTDLLRDPIGTIAELRAYPVTDTLDKTLIYVKGESGVFAYHYDATGSDDGAEVIQPASGSGRWIKVIGADSYTNEEAVDAVAAALVGGNNITVTYDDGNDSITIDGQPGYTDEEARDALAAALVAGTNVSISVDDNADTITISATDTNTNQLTTWTLSDGVNSTTIAHNDTVEFTGAGGISVTESAGTVTIDGSGVSGSDNLGNHTATQDLNMGTHDITGNKLRFVDSSAFSSHPDYFFHGKYDATGPTSKPAKIVLYADDGNTGAGRGEYISIQPPDAGQLSGSYGLKFPTTTGSADQVMTLPSGWSGTGTAQLEWQDRCCNNGIADITIGAEGAPTGDGEISWDGSTDTLTYTPPDLSAFIELGDLSVSTSGTASGGGALSYDDATGAFTFTPAQTGIGLAAGTYGSTSNSQKIDEIVVDSNGLITSISVGSTGSGDVSGVTLTADSGSASDSTGNVDLTIAGGTGITTSATGTTVTISATSTGDITAVTAGIGLDGGATTGAATLNVATLDFCILDFQTSFSNANNGMGVHTLTGAPTKWYDGSGSPAYTSQEPVIYPRDTDYPIDYVIELHRPTENAKMFLVYDYVDTGSVRHAFTDGQKITIHNFGTQSVYVMADPVHDTTNSADALQHTPSQLVIGTNQTGNTGFVLGAGKGIVVVVVSGVFRILPNS